MEKSYFLFEDKKNEIKSKFSIDHGWLKIYESFTKSINDSSCVYCCLIAASHLEDYQDSYSWPLTPGSEGKPAVYGDNTYKTYDKEGLEPFLFSKHFSTVDRTISYLDLSEEFILYFKLLEEGTDKQNRTFYYVDDYGELDRVVEFQPKSIRIKLKYLKEYITIREMHFVICFDFMRLLTKIPKNWNLDYGEKLTNENQILYSHLIRPISNKTQSWIIGRIIINPNEQKKTHYDLDSDENQDFIIGYDEEGEFVLENCSNRDNNHFTLTFFDKDVLSKYYNEPQKYEVDGFSVSSKFFRLKIDNNVEDYVPVFLRDLVILPVKEQLHWKQYNIPPEEGMKMSGTYYRTMIEGEWAEEPEALDLYFKAKYKSFNEKWESKYGWPLYKPLSNKDEFLFKSLHVIKSNNIKSFCEQTLTMVKLTIDRLNEKELSNGLKLEANDRGITKFEKFLEKKNLRIPDMFEFLRHLQNLRSGLIAHSFSNKNADCKKAMKYFNFSEENYINVSEDIFIKSINTLNTLEDYFEL